MKIYVAGKYGTDEVESLIEDIDASTEHEIACDWTYFPVNKPYREYASNNTFSGAMISGVKDSDVLILVCYDGMYGAMVEFGAALAHGKEVWIILNDCRESIFMAHTGTQIYTAKRVRDKLGLSETSDKDNT